MNLNSPPSPYEDHDHYNQSDHATSAFSCHIFFDESPSRTYRPQHQEDEGCVSYRSGSNEAIKMDDDRLKLSLVWKRDQDKGVTLSEHNHVRQTRVIEDTKYTGHKSLKIKSNYIQEFEDHKRLQYSFPSESTELSSNTTSCNNNATSYNNNNDNNRIRVCADCNTTKTPLWRSGPQGPKSLCNACGIRQRKARRAMAIAAAATVGTPPRTEAPPSMKIKVHQKEKISKKRHSTNVENKIKKKKKLGFEEFLINLNKELAFHRVFPQDEKEAAILLMALSSGLLHS